MTTDPAAALPRLASEGCHGTTWAAGELLPILSERAAVLWSATATLRVLPDEAGSPPTG